jgi:tetratricopeptide (TPR) repeat protein
MRNLSRVVAVVVLAVLTAPNVARADTAPSLWQRAAVPGRSEADRLHREVSEAVAAAQLSRRDQALRRTHLSRARAALEEATALQSVDVRLRFDLGRVLELQDDHARAVDVLRGALEAEPDHPSSTEAWLMLAYAAGHTDQSHLERDAYRAFLLRTVHESAKSTATLNLAECEMRLGNLDGAILGYRAALQSSDELGRMYGGYDTYRLALWGLAVAQDRIGDPRAGARTAASALAEDPGLALVGQGEHVFFVPAYERAWYLGMGFSAMAETRPAGGERLSARRAAFEQWSEYVRRATPQDRWLPLARAHQARAKADLDRELKSTPEPAPAEQPSLPW